MLTNGRKGEREKRKWNVKIVRFATIVKKPIGADMSYILMVKLSSHSQRKCVL